jgi:hypothetical protein
MVSYSIEQEENMLPQIKRADRVTTTTTTTNAEQSNLKDLSPPLSTSTSLSFSASGGGGGCANNTGMTNSLEDQHSKKSLSPKTSLEAKSNLSPVSTNSDSSSLINANDVIPTTRSRPTMVMMNKSSSSFSPSESSTSSSSSSSSSTSESDSAGLSLKPHHPLALEIAAKQNITVTKRESISLGKKIKRFLSISSSKNSSKRNF